MMKKSNKTYRAFSLLAALAAAALIGVAGSGCEQNEAAEGTFGDAAVLTAAGIDESTGGGGFAVGLTIEDVDSRVQLTQEQREPMQEALNRIAPTRRTPSGMVMMLSDEAFRFDFDKATLKPANKEMLSRIAGILLASEGYRLFVDGHTDDIGTDEYNQGLSERRAEAVQQYLVAAGIPPEVVAVQGFGKSQPLVKEQTKAARANNRRVEIGIVDTIVHYGQAVRN